MDPRLLLEQTALFGDLAPASRLAIAERCQVRRMGRREVLFLEGQEGEAVYVLAVGSVRLSKAAPDGREVVIKLVRPGEMFAEAILFEKDRYPVTATVTAPSVLLVIPRHQIHRMLEGREFRNDFIGVLLRKQRYLADRIRYLTSCDVEDRFFQFLREHYGDGNLIQVNLSKKDMAAAIGATPETFSRLILRLRRERKILSWTGKTLKLKPSRPS